MKLAIVIGHNSKAQGAVRVDTGETEYEFNTRLAQQIQLVPTDLDIEVFRRISGGGYSRELKRVYENVDEWGADASIELHFNSFSKPSATGTEVFSSTSESSLVLATHVQAQMLLTLGLTDRGVLTKVRSDRGGGSLYSGQAPAILIEPFFGSNIDDCAAIDSLSTLARSIVRGAESAMSAFPRRNMRHSRTMQSTTRIRKTTAVGAVAAVGSAGAQVAEVLVGDADTVTDAVQAGFNLAQYLPEFSIALVLLCVALFIFSRRDGERIENARIDDHINGRR